MAENEIALKQVVLNNMLVLRIPETFRELTSEELDKMKLLETKPDACYFDRTNRIWISIGRKQLPWFSSIIQSTDDLAKRMEKTVAKNMKDYNYKLYHFIYRRIGDKIARCFYYSYTAKGKNMTAELCVIKVNQTAWVINLFYMDENKANSLLTWGKIIAKASWKDDIHYENQIKKSEACYKKLRRGIENKNDLPHIISLPVIVRDDEGAYFMAVYEFFFNRDDVNAGKVDRPTSWAVADINTGKVLRKYTTMEREFSDASYEVKYNIQEDNETDNEQDTYAETFALLDIVRSKIINENVFDEETYAKYMQMVMSSVPNEYQRFYTDLSIHYKK